MKEVGTIWPVSAVKQAVDANKLQTPAKRCIPSIFLNIENYRSKSMQISVSFSSRAYTSTAQRTGFWSATCFCRT